MDKTAPSLRDEQSARDRRLPLGGNPRGAPERVHGGIGEGKCGGGCGGVREIYWRIFWCGCCRVRENLYFCGGKKGCIVIF